EPSEPRPQAKTDRMAIRVIFSTRVMLSFFPSVGQGMKTETTDAHRVNRSPEVCANGHFLSHGGWPIGIASPGRLTLGSVHRERRRSASRGSPNGRVRS